MISLCFFACEEPPKETNVVRFRGSTMGTSYSVTTIDPIKASSLNASVDSILLKINEEVNTYDSTSMISQLNSGKRITLPVIVETDRLISENGGHLAANLALALQPMKLSGGAFDPTIGPLTEYYGFGASMRSESAVDQQEIERLLDFVGFSNIVIDSLDEDVFELSTLKKGVRLDLSAIAKGYAVDQISHLLEAEFNATSFFVEIGGETRAKGLSPRNTEWTIGVNTPLENAEITDFELIIGVKNAAIATSGNYRNRRIIDGKAFVHTIDPKTGIAKASSLLSATVVADNCATADAFATAVMASAENAENVLAKAGLAACLIYAKSDSTFDTRYVGDFQRYVLSSK